MTDSESDGGLEREVADGRCISVHLVIMNDSSKSFQPLSLGAEFKQILERFCELCRGAGVEIAHEVEKRIYKIKRSRYNVMKAYSRA